MSVVCRICARDFDEIPADAIELRRRYGIGMYRFPDGQVHEFRVITRTEASNRKPKLPLAQVVKVPAPKVEPEAKPVIDVASAASMLRKHFDTREVTLESPEEYPEPEYPEGEEPRVGEVLDLIVVSWTEYDNGGFNRPAIGLARIVRGRQQKGRQDGCFFRIEDVISEGTIRVGSRIRARLAEPISVGSHQFSLEHIEIYRD